MIAKGIINGRISIKNSVKAAELIPNKATNVGAQQRNPEKNEGIILIIPVVGLILQFFGASVKEKIDSDIFKPAINPKNNPKNRLGTAMSILRVSSENRIIGSQL